MYYYQHKLIKIMDIIPHILKLKGLQKYQDHLGIVKHIFWLSYQQKSKDLEGSIKHISE